jgi:hypothetical protein
VATIDRVAGGALILAALLTLALSRVLRLGTLRTPGPAYMPVLLALLLLLFGVLLVIFGGRSTSRPRSRSAKYSGGPSAARRRPAAVLA